MSEVVAVYGDGGVIGRNPSDIGGMWAYCHIDVDGSRIHEDSGLVLVGKSGSYGLDTISNNITELLAIIRALETLPDGWAGTVYTDSDCTRKRMIGNKREWPGVPYYLHKRAIDAKCRLGQLTWVLLGGHPTIAELTAGRRRDGFPCSEHNVWCDKRCCQLAAEFLSVR